MARLVDAQHARDGCDDVAPVANHDRVRIEHPIELRAKAVMVDGRGVGLDLGAMLVPPGLVRFPQGAEPRFPLVAGLDAVGEDAEHCGAVAADPGIGRAVPAELRRVGVDVDELRRGRKASELSRKSSGVPMTQITSASARA